MRTSAPSLPQRVDAVDALRGLAIVWMTAFHFSFDLNYFGLIRQDFLLDPFWTWQRTAIVSLFVLCAGVGQSVAVAQEQSWRRFGRRWSQVALCAVLVSVGSWLMFPQTFIYFGVLHGLAVMLVLLRLLAPWARRHLLAVVLLGAACIAVRFVAEQALGTGAVAEAFNGRALNWLGLVTRKPFTEDYVPLMPWLGVLLWGFALGTWALRRNAEILRLRLVPWLRPLAFLGRWSLSYYMLHQPVLIGGLMLVTWLV